VLKRLRSKRLLAAVVLAGVTVAPLAAGADPRRTLTPGNRLCTQVYADNVSATLCVPVP